MEKKIWKDINGWEEYYEVSNYGEVRNKKTGYLIIGDKNSAGYYRVCLYNKNNTPNKQRFLRHRLVAEHFIPNNFNLPEVNHNDCDLSNNCASNLSWTDKKENELHSRKYGGKVYKPFKVVFADGRIEIYESKSDLANCIGITPHAIKCWLNHSNHGYLSRGIQSLNYI